MQVFGRFKFLLGQHFVDLARAIPGSLFCTGLKLVQVVALPHCCALALLAVKDLILALGQEAF